MSEINDSAIVLLVCSFEMCNCLMQVNNPKYLDVTTGSLGGNTIFNAIQPKIGKFILIFLNQDANSSLVPVVLRGRKQYMINTEEVKASCARYTTEDELLAEMEKYLGSAAGNYLNSLLEYLHK